MAKNKIVVKANTFVLVHRLNQLSTVLLLFVGFFIVLFGGVVNKTTERWFLWSLIITTILTLITLIFTSCERVQIVK